MTTRRNIAVVLAGGTGSRVGLALPKQLIKIAGKPIIEHTIAALGASPHVDEIVVMMTPGYLDAVRALVRDGRHPKVTRILEGADTRNGTTRLALDAVGEQECNLVFHDAVRPLVSQRIIADCVAALEEYGAVDTAIPSADTVVRVDRASGTTLEEVLPRHLLRRGQTPQAFRSEVIRRAYDLAAQDPRFEATDDCTVVLRYTPEVPIAVVRGEDRNMKVTEPIDVYIADKLFQLESHSVPDAGTEAEQRAALEGRSVVVFGGSYGIGADIARLAEQRGARAWRFSRSETGTHVERRSDIVAACERVIEESGRIDLVVNTAGVLPRAELAETSEETIYLATDVNYLAPVNIAQVCFPHLQRTGGSLLLFTSSSYTRGRSGYSLYSSAKAAVVNLTQALGDEWAPDGVRINCLNPERTQTPMRTRAFGAEPEGTLLSSAAVAEAALRVLTSDMTGHVVDVRREDALASHLAAASAADAVHEEEPGDVLPEGVSATAASS
ncbi:bifunctional cytidylyltransferase/SDR family oxidoreductase [Quadrisphaera sp. DSM 44207]|uniref:bifunctional cytidylyltransferase/SDR family oxidoreductase n=1 Tax=Quadrisphaera sp. DSM 44207 TaxID=1881057 RepID=UPI0008899799|nr:bifunctional cytidylyltransferase/SDR family oxidoreductase [Quadrisphaera sp. DSM 44207]SDQ67999.1 2-C-methyl-D-erythritol 4-phosphate cytidylyltransferase [Quadrisphaera sp. DSM 44207]